MIRHRQDDESDQRERPASDASVNVDEAAAFARTCRHATRAERVYIALVERALVMNIPSSTQLVGFTVAARFTSTLSTTEIDFSGSC